MEFKIASNAGTCFEIVEGLPAALKNHQLAFADVATAVCDFGTLIFQNIKGDGWDVWKSKYMVHKSAEITGRADQPVIELHTSQKNHFRYHWDGIAQPLLKSLQFNLSYVPHGHNVAWLEESQVYDTFDFHLTLDMLEDYAKVYPELNEFILKVQDEQPADLSGHCTLTTKMQHLLKEMQEFHAKPAIYKKIMTAWIEIFLHEAFEVLCTKREKKNKIITAGMREKAMHAKTILETRLGNPPTIAELAKLCMSNTSSIQTAFKEVFSMTIDAYSKEARLEEIKKILLNNQADIDLNAVSDQTGFYDGANLSRFFKQQTGFTPGEFKRKGKLKN